MQGSRLSVVKQMEPGDSHWFDCSQHGVSGAVWHVIRNSAHKKQFTTRKEGEGTRVWRIL